MLLPASAARGFEHRGSCRVSPGPAVHHARSAGRSCGGADELPSADAGLIHAQAVQVELALDAPVPGAQALRHLHANAGAAKAELVVGVEQGAPHRSRR